MNWAGKKLLIVGLGLSGWSAVRYLHRQGAVLKVCDSRTQPPHAGALAAEYPQVPLQAGSLPLSLLDDGVEALVVSPGLDLSLPLLAEARRRGLPLLGDIEVFACDNSVPVLAVTGSNGKSTVVTLLGEMARVSGRRVLVGGNIGTPALDLLSEDADLIVLELSSFQLELTESLQCVAAANLNLSPDHIDRHGDMQAYAAAKARIFAHAQQAVVNDEDALTAIGAGASPLRFGLSPDCEFRLQGDALTVRGEIWLRAAELKLLGAHNHLNVLAALALGEAAGLPRETMCQAARDFSGLPHRCEWVAERGGVRWINDSKGTNVGATLAALDGLPPRVVLLAGGQSKGGDFRPWVAPLTDKGRAVFLFGEDAGKIASDLAALPDSVCLREVGTLQAAVAQADDVAEPGDSVLLSPGCASFDQFSGYAARGDCFRELVRALP